LITPLSLIVFRPIPWICHKTFHKNAGRVNFFLENIWHVEKINERSITSYEIENSLGIDGISYPVWYWACSQELYAGSGLF
jgi:hypothetical protein